MAHELSQRPQLNAISKASHRGISSMIDEYAVDLDFKDIKSPLVLGKKEEPYIVKDCFLIYGSRLCVTHSLCEKVISESHACPCMGHRGILAMLKGMNIYVIGHA